MSRQGSIRRDASGRWYFVVDASSGGQRKQIRRRGFRTRAEANDALTALLGSLHTGTYVAPERMTLRDYLETWVGTLALQGRRPTTVESYTRHLTLHVMNRPVGNVRLQALSPLDLDHLYADLLNDGRGKGRGLSPRTVLYVHGIVHRALADAARKGLVVRNVADLASPPSASAARPPAMAVWTPEERRTFLGSVRDDRLFAFYRLAAMTGMRRGEVIGLRWRDVDLDAGRLAVRQAITVVHHQPVVSEVKTDRSRRSIELDPGTVAVLRSHRRAQLEERVALGPGFTDRGLVFSQPDGSCLHPDAMTSAFAWRVRRTGLPRLRLHDLRRTHATHLLAAGQNVKVVSERLGHASASFTLDRYSHVLPGLQASAASASCCPRGRPVTNL